jgi:hypothetical protein
MIVYKDLVTGVEYYSDAKKLKTPVSGDTKTEVEGLVMIASAWIKDVDDEEEDAKILDYYSMFPNIIREERTPKYTWNAFKKEFLKPWMMGLCKILKDNGTISSKEEMTAFQGKLEAASDYLKSQWDQISVHECDEPSGTYTLKSGESVDLLASPVFEIYVGDDTEPHFMFFKDAYKTARF